MFKIWSTFRKIAEKISEKKICFFDKKIWIGCVKLLLLRREYQSSAVNVLRKSSKILHMTKREFFQFNIFLSDQ